MRAPFVLAASPPVWTSEPSLMESSVSLPMASRSAWGGGPWFSADFTIDRNGMDSPPAPSGFGCGAGPVPAPWKRQRRGRGIDTPDPPLGGGTPEAADRQPGAD